MKLTKSRRVHTTQGADPTTVVRWFVTEPAGRAIRTMEFQGIIKAHTVSAYDGEEMSELDPMVAQLIHEGLEAEYELDQMLREAQYEQGEE